MSRPRHRLITILVVLAVVGCAPNTPTPSPSAARTTGPTPSTAPSVAASPPASVGPSASPVGLAKGSVAVTVSDRLRVRSQPRVANDSVLYDPVLPIGTSLFVLDGPISDSGYVWYKVAPVSFSELAGPGFGWVASGDHDGTPWVTPASGPAAQLAVATSTTPRAATDPAAAKRAAGYVNALGVDMYKKLLPGKGNLVFSPASIEIALAMARGGAKGTTATEMDRVLHSPGWDGLASGLNSLDRALSSRGASWSDGEGAKQLTLRLANAPFAQRGWNIETQYLDALGAAFGAGLRLVDYVRDAEAARATINGWVRDRTAGRIKELLARDQVTPATRIALVNAIYLKAQWAIPFYDSETKDAAFTAPGGRRLSVPTMQLFGGPEVPYARSSGWQATELLYADPRSSQHLAMLLVRPDDLASFEAGLNAAKLQSIVSAIASERVRNGRMVKCPNVPYEEVNCYPYSLGVYLPRFKAATHADLIPALKALGMKVAFDPGAADFSGISKQERIFIGAVVHEANIDVDEKGTEAAAATAVVGDTGGGPSPIKELSLRFNKPFLFFVRDVDTGAILFMGRVVDPAA
jgi:serpin B